MKVVIPGGSGHVGAALRRHFAERGDEVIIVSRRPGSGEVEWDGRTLGDWANTINGADVVINLAGRSVNCRYSESNLKAMMDSRVNSTRVVGEAIAAAKRPPRVWLQASTATIYAHRYDAPNDEATGIIGGNELGVPAHWAKSVDIARAWEAELGAASVTGVRKVAMRSAMTMSIDRGSIFDALRVQAKRGIGGRWGDGKQFVSWIHEFDFANAVQFLIERDDLDGAINLCSPNPLPQVEFMAELRRAVGVSIGLNSPNWLIEVGTRLLRTESELVLKSRRVVPTRLLEAGFQFVFSDWRSAVQDLVQRFPC